MVGLELKWVVIVGMGCFYAFQYKSKSSIANHYIFKFSTKFEAHNQSLS
jgi:hypothetical protein